MGSSSSSTSFSREDLEQLASGFQSCGIDSGTPPTQKLQDQDSAGLNIAVTGESGGGGQRDQKASPSHSTYFNWEELKQLQAAYQTGGVDSVTPLVKKKLQDLESVEINIAITGVSGTGKSKFINAIRGLQSNDKGAAPTSNTETTLEPTRYSHPIVKGVYTWDLPGIGTETFKAKKYLKQMNFKTYDFFIIISHPRFTENDVLLAKEIKRLGKNFFFVRSKFDNDLNAAKMERKDCVSEKELENIRKDYVSHLEKAGIKSPSVFVISNFHPDQFDFPKLRESIVDNLSDIKKDVLILSIPNITVQCVEQKRQILKKKIWMMAATSAFMGAIPLPGLSLVYDISLLVTGITYFRGCLGLHDTSLNNLARLVGKPVEVLKAVIRTPLVGEIDMHLIIKSLLGTTALAISAIELAVDFIPIVGSIFGASSSFVVNYKLLNDALDDLVENAKRVVKAAFATN